MENNRTETHGERDIYVFQLWYKHNWSFSKIAKQHMPGALSRKTISNYVYSRAQKTDKQRLIVKMSDELRKSISNMPQIIDFIHANQPKAKLSESTIRRIICRCLKEKKKLINNQ